jgi:hypothetical protein
LLRTDAPKKIAEIQTLVTKMFGNEECLAQMNRWGLKIAKTPSKHTGYKLIPGNIIMGQKPLSEERIVHDIEMCGSEIGIKMQQNKLFD